MRKNLNRSQHVDELASTRTYMYMSQVNETVQNILFNERGIPVA